MDRATALLIGLAAITLLFTVDLLIANILRRLMFKIVDALPAAPWVRPRYKSQSMPEQYAKFRRRDGR